MSRSPAILDVFSALAEPRRRQIVELLAFSPHRDVSDLIRRLRLPQPTVSKHLSVLRRVGLVAVEKAGQHRLYRLEADGLRPVHDWLRTFERLWSDQLAAVKHHAEQAAAGACVPATAEPHSTHSEPTASSTLKE